MNLDTHRHREGFTLWLTGLSGAGKSTLATALCGRLRQRGYDVEVLDGDDIRRHLSAGSGYSKPDRDTNVRRIGYVARLLSRNGIIAIVATISPYRNARDDVREEHQGRFVEVFVDCPVNELIKRDVKGLYARALRGEIEHFTGVSDPYEKPPSPELVVKTDFTTVDESVESVIVWLEARHFISP